MPAGSSRHFSQRLPSRVQHKHIPMKHTLSSCRPAFFCAKLIATAGTSLMYEFASTCSRQLVSQQRVDECRFTQQPPK
jgi:hypothetical protein